MVKTYGEMYRQVKHLLQEEEGERAAYTARELLSYVSGKPSAALMAMQNDDIPEKVAKDYLYAAGRILAGEPLAYILGSWSFYGLELTVSPDVLIPRDDTMAVVDLAMELRMGMPSNPRILDLCTGSGCIGLALAYKMKDARITMCDISVKALKIAKKNAADLHLSGRATCLQADALQPVGEFLGKFDMIISNPPYITAREMTELQRSVRDYEPHMALFGGEDGLDFYHAIVKNYGPALKPGGFMCFEFGMGQEKDVCQILRDHNFVVVGLKKDSGGIVRAVSAQKKERYDTNGNG